jgi:hypothetical protein
MRKKTGWLTGFFLVVALGVQAQKNVSFFEEHIDFEMDTVYFSINGIYSFCNPADIEINQQILFPFAVNTSPIDSIRVINLSSYEKVPFERLKKAIGFNFTIAPGDTVDINIFYRQELAIKNTYVITSTQSWKKPLETAVYTLSTPLEMKIESFSYLPDSKEVSNGKMLYRWTKNNFMPKQEFEVVIDKD